jgi:hypothetical protein
MRGKSLIRLYIKYEYSAVCMSWIWRTKKPPISERRFVFGFLLQVFIGGESVAFDLNAGNFTLFLFKRTNGDKSVQKFLRTLTGSLSLHDIPVKDGTVYNLAGADFDEGEKTCLFLFGLIKSGKNGGGNEGFEREHLRVCFEVLSWLTI